ncbi:sulfatase-like protein [Phytophthora cinnamomi]|uniref:sulfatase-like protein n=1 Tax=Phytophthora cinnamomi TaxID=4785 RepID=UPI00355A6D02|nr:sulfatase-like protein [Phytophthora cinnamomi]
MDSHPSLYPQGSGHHSPRCRFPEVRTLNAKHLVTPTEFDVKVSRRWSWATATAVVAEYSSRPWFGWFVVYAFMQFCFSVARSLALRSLVDMYGTAEDYTVAVRSAALSLGFLEDFVCTSYFAAGLWTFDTLQRSVTQRFTQIRGIRVGIIVGVAKFAVSWLFFFTMMAPFVVDMLLVVYRDMRFSFALLATLIRERDHLKAAPISYEEIHRGHAVATGLVLASTLFAAVRTWTSWIDLARWNPTHILQRPVNLRQNSGVSKTVGGVKYVEVALEEGGSVSADDGKPQKMNDVKHTVDYNPIACGALILLGLVGVPAITVGIRCACSPLVAYSALNATLNEFFLHAFQPEPFAVELTKGNETLPWVEKYIDDSELHRRFGDNTLYRRTTGFTGDLAFNISIDSDNPPNVLVIGVESFRFRDSRYLVGDADLSNLFKGTNITITPNFDRWAKRGVALRNIWSSIPTSRSLESLLFAQIPYNSNVQSGITGGKKDTALSGLPQLFKQKGYETYFTTGSSITLDEWNVFLPAHGFDTVWDDKKMARLLGDLIIDRATKQRERVANGETKRPLFLTHYTISSHEPYDSVPRWYFEAEKPDFSDIYGGEQHAERIKNYLEVRYFTDMELGKFMDRMATEGILNDTIVVIVGDHGQAPEINNPNIHEESVTRVPAVIIAEGRLGDAVGLVIDEVAEQYDILNTLADITGLPEGGFLQSGVGRSLKRKFSAGDHVVFSNDPIRKMAVVRGHERLRYDAVTDTMMLHNTETDYFMKSDLLPALSAEERAQWEAFREDGRRIAMYYMKRWDENCLLAVKCST